MLPSTSSITSFPPPRSVASKRLNKSRHFTLPYLVVLSMTSMILATIYAYCVHQNNHHRAALLGSATRSSSNSSTTSTWSGKSMSMFARDSGNVAGQTTSTASSSSIDNAPPSQVALVFYSATLPCASLAHSLFESTLLKFTPQSLTRYPASHLPHILFALASLLTAGWIVTSSFWTHCELALTHSAVCPPQVRDHLMYGILELSIAKSALGWALVAGYAVHLGFMVRWLRVVRQWEVLKKGMSGVKGAEWEAEMGKKRSWCERCEDEEVGGCTGDGEKGIEMMATMKMTKKGFGVLSKGKDGVNKVTVTVKDVSVQSDERRTSNGPPEKAPYFPPPPTRPTRPTRPTSRR